MEFANVKFQNKPIVVCRTGYTGEHGYEIIPTSVDALEIWKALSIAVAGFNGRLCGLGARDILRTEMGYPLHGHELTLDISPIQAVAGWAVDLTKEKFTGKQILEEQKRLGTKLKLKAIVATDR